MGKMGGNGITGWTWCQKTFVGESHGYNLVESSGSAAEPWTSLRLSACPLWFVGEGEGEASAPKYLPVQPVPWVIF